MSRLNSLSDGFPVGRTRWSVHKWECSMICHERFTVGALAIAVLLMAANANAAKLRIGDRAPDWNDLQGVDGKSHSLSDYKEAKVVVVVFTCNHCPVARAYEDRLVAFQRDYQDKGVQVVAINVNDTPNDRLAKMKERAKQRGFNFPYLFDPTQASARGYGATCTPHFFLLDGDRHLAYMGAMDDNIRADKAKQRYLRDAVDAVLEGKTPEKPVTQQRGCGIKWKKSAK